MGEKANNTDSRSFGNLSRKEILWILVVVIVVMTLPILLTQTEFFGVQFSDTGEIGDTIGGVMGPFIAIGAAVLTYIAFKVQYIANRDLRRDGENQKVISRFYEMLRIHKANIDEFQIRSPTEGNFWTGRRCFVYMFEELKLCYDQLDMCIKTYYKEGEPRLSPTQEWKIDLAYRIFFHGVPNERESEQFINEFTKGTEQLADLVSSYLLQLRTFQKYYDYKLNKNQISSYGCIDFSSAEINASTNQVVRIASAISLYYYPFDGHILRLGHTYRHLFHTVKFVLAQNEKKLVEDEETIDLLRMLRAQLSNHEQLLLYYNGLSIGESGLITDISPIGK